MTILSAIRAGFALLVVSALLWAQNPPQQPPVVDPNQRPVLPTAPPRPQTQPAPAKPPAGTPGTRRAVSTIAPGTVPGALNLQNASLVEVIDILARSLKINYILDPRVKGSVTLNTYGEIKQVDLRPLLDTILRINGALMVQIGDVYRIVPLAEGSRQPLSPLVNGKDLPDDERTLLNLIFLKYVTVGEITKLLEPFLGESAKMTSYEAANLLMILDNSRNMRRTLELIALFDNDTLAGQRVRLYEVTQGRPFEIAKDLEEVFKAYALSDKASAIRFMPIDRINTIIAVAPNPGVFTEVEKWLKKLDVPAKVTAGSIDNYLYRLKYGRAEIVGMALMQLYGGFGGGYGGGYGGGGYGGFGASMMGGYGGGGYPGGGYPGMGGYGAGGYGAGGYGAGGYGAGGYGAGGYGAGGYGAGSNRNNLGYTYPGGLGPNARAGASPLAGAQAGAGGVVGGGVSPVGGEELTGSYLGMGGAGGFQMHPRIIPNPFDNTLLIQGTPQEWEQISKLIRQIDIAPRQVLIEAKVYEVDLTGDWSAGVQAYLQARGPASDRNWSGNSNLNNIAGLNLTAGLLVGHARELLAFLNTKEATTHSKVISAPSIIATDSIAASINVGQSVPTLSSQTVSGVQIGGTSQFANTISNQDTGVQLKILARVNASGVVTMVIDQEVSAPTPPPSNTNVSINSPSFSKRNVSTQVTVQDGDTVSIGGIIQETDSDSSSGIPWLHRIPIIGAAFGAKSTTHARTELIVFLTPRVIYDTNQIAEASEELKSKLKRLEKLIKE